MDVPVRLVFAGSVKDGFDRDTVKLQLGQWLKLDADRLEALFSGRRVVIKKGLAADQAAAWVQRFARLGATLAIEPDLETLQSQREAPAAPAALDLAAPVEDIVCPACGERQPKRILCRACATDMPRGIAAQEEERAAARAERIAAARARRGLKPLPGPGTDADAGDDAPPLFGRSFEGRLGRMSYLAGNLTLWAALGVALLLLLRAPGVMTVVLLMIVAVMVLWQGVRLTTLRMHDFNRSGWWALLFNLPVVGPILSVVIMLVPGNDGPNDYGDPAPERHAGQAIGAVVVLGLCLTLGLRSAERAVQRMSEEQEQEEASAEPAERMTLESALVSPEAVLAFKQQYLTRDGHRAFARSPSGAAFAWRTEANSPEEASTEALAECNRRRPADSSSCQLVHVDDSWVLP